MEQLNSYCKGCDQLSAPHRRRDDGQWICEDCGHLVECSDPQWSDNCDGDLTTPHEVKKGLCQGCMAVIDSWSDDSEETSGSEQAKLMTDGGTVSADEEDSDDGSIGCDYALVGELEIKASEDRVRIGGYWGEVVFGTSGEDVEEAFERLKEFAMREDDPRPDADADVYRTTKEETWNRCLHCDHLPNADHHDILGEQVVRCRWDKVNDFDVFNERGVAVKCPSCGGSVRDEPSEHVDGLANVECRDCGEEYVRESYDFGDFPAGKQELKNSDHEVVARVQ